MSHGTRNMRYTKYPNLMLVLLLVEKQNELLLNNHGERPTRTLPMHSHATHVSTIWFMSQGLRRKMKLEKKSRTPTQRETQ